MHFQKSYRRRIKIAWLLLLVYVPIMTAVTFHHHGEAQKVISVIQCQDCEHHVHHDGHILAYQHTMHDCVLCQLQSATFLSPVILALSTFVVRHHIIRGFVCAKCQQLANDIKSARAPPPYLIYRVLVS